MYRPKVFHSGGNWHVRGRALLAKGQSDTASVVDLGPDQQTYSGHVIIKYRLWLQPVRLGHVHPAEQPYVQ
jgi:hypothetical protein